MKTKIFTTVAMATAIFTTSLSVQAAELRNGAYSKKVGGCRTVACGHGYCKQYREEGRRIWMNVPRGATCVSINGQPTLSQGAISKGAVAIQNSPAIKRQTGTGLSIGTAKPRVSN